MLARLLQKKQSDVFDVEIHPGAQFGRGLTFGQGCGVTIGETVVVGDNVYIMHGATLGATGTSPDFDRHPKIGSNVLLGAKCTVIGNITVGDGSVVASASLVNRLVPPGYTAIGIPARMFPPRAKDQ
jgi:serine O-acetyltransferase